MATLIELRNFANDSVLRNKIKTSIALSVRIVLASLDTVPPFSQAVGDHDLRVTWALATLGKIETQADSFVELVLSKNNTATAVQIQAAIDSNDESDIDPISDDVKSCVDLAAGGI